MINITCMCVFATCLVLAVSIHLPHKYKYDLSYHVCGRVTPASSPTWTGPRTVSTLSPTLATMSCFTVSTVSYLTVVWFFRREKNPGYSKQSLALRQEEREKGIDRKLIRP